CEAPSQSPPDQSPPSAESAPATDGAMTEPPFAGRWAANADWCATTDGAERPIRITASRFEGYENHCDIRSVVRTPEGWDATLACQAEGESHQERVSMDVRDERMTLT